MNAALHHAWLVKIAELVRPDSEYAAADIARIKTAGYTFLATIYGDDLSTDRDPHLGDVVTFGFLAASPTGELVAAIRGTDTILEWIHDADFLMVPAPVNRAPGLADDGFTTVYRSLRIGRDKSEQSVVAALDDLGTAKDISSVTVCGHSLGGALATLLTLDIRLNTGCAVPASYTFASPRVGDHIFAGAYNSLIETSYRVANDLDLVTKLPTVLPLPYEHVNLRCKLSPKGVALTVPCMHHLDTYLYLLDQLAGGSEYALDDACKESKLVGIDGYDL